MRRDDTTSGADASKRPVSKAEQYAVILAWRQRVAAVVHLSRWSLWLNAVAFVAALLVDRDRYGSLVILLWLVPTMALSLYASARRPRCPACEQRQDEAALACTKCGTNFAKDWAGDGPEPER